MTLTLEDVAPRKEEKRKRAEETKKTKKKSDKSWPSETGESFAITEAY